jgi:hypothetical protein
MQISGENILNLFYWLKINSKQVHMYTLGTIICIHIMYACMYVRMYACVYVCMYVGSLGSSSV